LVLQGGAVFGVCHLGVVKALGLRGLLPRIIVGTGAGALVAALVGVCLEEELLEFLEEGIVGGGGSGYDQGENRQDEGKMTGNWVSTKMRRLYSDISAGYFLDVATLEKCVVENVGDVTFEEAYSRTRKVLNISVPNDYASGIPSLFNYLTTPNVVSKTG
jgi:TAG lipase/lysophosphatidylethanolamine acyltransferase